MPKGGGGGHGGGSGHGGGGHQQSSSQIQYARENNPCYSGQAPQQSQAQINSAVERNPHSHSYWETRGIPKPSEHAAYAPSQGSSTQHQTPTEIPEFDVTSLYALAHPVDHQYFELARSTAVKLQAKGVISTPTNFFISALISALEATSGNVNEALEIIFP